MTVISITITESTIQLVAGIPRTITLETNIPATIFYTVDGTTPDTTSSVYVGAITLPTDLPSVVFQAFATNGTDTSSIVEEIYAPSTYLAHHPRDRVLNQDATLAGSDKYPFGDNGNFVQPIYGRSGGITIDDPAIENIPDGYDGSGTLTFTNGTDEPLSAYDIIYSTAKLSGQMGPNIGTLPKVTIFVPKPKHPSTSSQANDKLFNPRAMVIYQDGTVPPADPNISRVNRALFSLQDVERARSGASMMNTALDNSMITGSFLKSYYNPSDNTITYYYRDSDTNQWIISKEPYVPRSSDNGALYKMVFSSRDGASDKVFSWLPFQHRRLI